MFFPLSYLAFSLSAAKEGELTASHQFIAALTEVTYKQVQTLAVDLEAFSKFAFLNSFLKMD